MTIDELVLQLQLLQGAGLGQTKVVVASDEEGNDFKHLQAITKPQAMRGSYWVESIWDESGNDLVIEVPEDDHEAFLAIVLWP